MSSGAVSRGLSCASHDDAYPDLLRTSRAQGGSGTGFLGARIGSPAGYPD